MAAETLPTQGTPLTVDNMNLVSLQVPLPKLLDLALGTPEIGAVNFNILHTFLHVLLRQINLQAIKVEYRGDSAKRVQSLVTTLKPETLLQFQEYSITNGEDAPRQEDDDIVEISVADTQVPTEVITDDDVKVTKGVKRKPYGKDDRHETVLFVESIVDETTPTALAFKDLEQTVRELEQRYQALDELSKFPEVLERLKGVLTDPISDVWHFININKRLDASAEGIDKLATMVQDYMIRTDPMVVSADERLSKLEHKISKIQRKLAQIQKIIKHEDEEKDEVREEKNDKVNDKEDEIDKEEENDKEKEKIDTVTREKNDKVTDDMEDELTDEITDTDTIDEAADRQPINDRDLREIRQDIEALQTDVAVLQNDVVQIQEELQNINERFIQLSDAAAPVTETIADGEETISEVTNNITNLEQCIQVVRTHVKDLRDVGHRVTALEQEIGDLIDRLDSVQAAVRKPDDDETKHVVKLREIEMYVDKLTETMNKLLDDKEKQEGDINTLVQQIEVLKIVKVDKEDLEDALADKADAQAVIRKVSHDKFDSVCEDLARGLEEAIDKLAKQEAIWQQALDEVQSEIAGKVDKMEMTPLKDFMDTKLKSLQEKLKIMAEARREIEAAGTKKLLRDVQCISCDKDVVMRTEEVGRFRMEPLPCTTSIKPYLTYKLDQVRKQQKKLPHKNMIQFEAAVQEEVRRIKAKEELLKTPREGHLVNRYCGGSHTTTTPQQRVTRTGHFLTQWGPKVIQMTEGMIMGRDGVMYHSRPTKTDVCGPTCWESSICEDTRSPEHPTSVPSPNRKSSRRSNANKVSQKRNEKRSSKELKILEPAEKPIEEQEVTQEMYTYEANDE
ncbi:golgin IMH1-like isoform X2 [Pseudomyrmex gracilis]|uniref:golgin IMH1-like isoform X2 n=1 Tax=Pseudomyrmex gracilis TaxID=219809 RepID=UPI0009953946|nr:golgin IMH1-like isoform X2 [Pseudomyrmex gracilis]